MRSPRAASSSRRSRIRTPRNLPRAQTGRVQLRGYEGVVPPRLEVAERVLGEPQQLAVRQSEGSSHGEQPPALRRELADRLCGRVQATDLTDPRRQCPEQEQSGRKREEEEAEQVGEVVRRSGPVPTEILHLAAGPLARPAERVPELAHDDRRPVDRVGGGLEAAADAPSGRLDALPE